MERTSPQRELPAELAAALRAARRARGWSLRTTAQHSGVSLSMLSRLEGGVRVPSVALAADLAAALELDTDTAAWLAQVAISDRGRSRPASVAVEARRSHGSETTPCDRRSTTCPP